jgi:tetratricopeptide (TPR) repeat protein
MLFVNARRHMYSPETTLSDKQPLRDIFALIHVNRGASLAKTGDYDGAIAECSEAIRLNPHLAEAFHNRALDWHALHRFDKALSDLSQAIRLNPKFHQALCARALLHSCAGTTQYRDLERATADAQLACELTNWADPLCLEVLAATDAESGNVTRAVQLQTEAVKLQFDVSSRGVAITRLHFYESLLPKAKRGRDE